MAQLDINVLQGDGTATLRLMNEADSPVILDVRGADFLGLGQLYLDAGTTLVVDAADLEALTISNISGDGKLRVDDVSELDLGPLSIEEALAWDALLEYPAGNTPNYDVKDTPQNLLLQPEILSLTDRIELLPKEVDVATAAQLTTLEGFNQNFNILDISTNILASDIDVSGADSVGVTDAILTVEIAEQLTSLENFDGQYLLADRLENLAAEGSAAVLNDAAAYVITDSQPQLGVLTDSAIVVLEGAVNAGSYDWLSLSAFGGNRDMQLADTSTFMGTDADEVFVSMDAVVETMNASAGGNNILMARGAGQVNEMIGGNGDDDFVILGDLSNGGKNTSRATTELLGHPLAELNGETFTANGEAHTVTITGGGGSDTLHLFGDIDASEFVFDGVDNLRLYSDIVLNAANIGDFLSIAGDGRSILRLEAGEATEITINTDISGIGQIDLGANVTLAVTDEAQLGGARVITGEGKLTAEAGVFENGMAGYSVTDSLNIDEVSGSGNVHTLASVSSRPGDEVETVTPPGSTQSNNYKVITGTGGDDYVAGNMYGNILDGLAGDDILAGRGGNNIYRVSDAGKKIIIHTEGQATIDLSSIDGHGANISLLDNAGGTIGGGWGEIQLGFDDENYGVGRQDTSNYNLMFIVDTSSSMSGSRLQTAKDAIDSVLNVYDDIGDAAVRVVNFGSSATSTYGGNNAWYNVSDARDVVNSLSTSGLTNFQAGLTTGMQAWGDGQGEVFNVNGNNVIYFMADGLPNEGNHRAVQDQWQSFLEDNDILARALGIDINSPTAKAEMDVIAYNGRTGEDIDSDTSLQFDTFVQDLTDQALGDQAFIQNLIGTQQGDQLTGNDLDNRIEGAGGDNNIYLRGGNDLVVGGPDDDTVWFTKGREHYEIVTEDVRDLEIDFQGGTFRPEHGDVIIRDLGAPDDTSSGAYNGAYNVLRGVETARFFGGEEVDLQALIPEHGRIVEDRLVTFSVENGGSTGLGYQGDLFKFDFGKYLTGSSSLTVPVDVPLIGNPYIKGAVDTVLELSMPYEFRFEPMTYDLDYNVPLLLDRPENVKPGETFDVITGFSQKMQNLALGSLEAIAGGVGANVGLDFKAGIGMEARLGGEGLDDDLVLSFGKTQLDLPGGGTVTGNGGQLGLKESIAGDINVNDINPIVFDPDPFQLIDFSSKTSGKLFDELLKDTPLEFKYDLGAFKDLKAEGSSDVFNVSYPPGSMSYLNELRTFLLASDSNQTISDRLGFSSGEPFPLAPIYAEGVSETKLLEADLDLIDLLGLLYPPARPLSEASSLEWKYELNAGGLSWIPGVADSYTSEVEVDLVGAGFTLGISPVLNHVFTPTDLAVQISTPWGEKHDGRVGDVFEFTMPDDWGDENGEEVDLITSYNLQGDHTLGFGLAFDATAELSILDITKIELLNKIITADLEPLFNIESPNFASAIGDDGKFTWDLNTTPLELVGSFAGEATGAAMIA